MSELTIDILKKILANVPDGYAIGFSSESFYHSINKVEINVTDVDDAPLTGTVTDEMVIFK